MLRNYIKPVLGISFLILAFFVSVGFENKPIPTTHYPLETPALEDGDVYLKHSGYAFVYNEKHEQAKWIAYCLTKKETEGSLERTDHFVEDPIVKTGTATNADYSKSGFDRGHLAPAADMKWSELAMDESFYYSNMSPQLPAFNRGIWKKLEEQVRDWAVSLDSVLIVTGPILSESLPSIGTNKVSVPKFYYKAILDFKGTHSKAIAFIMPNKGSKAPLMSFAVTIDELEKLTGMNLFYQLDDHLEQSVEAKTCPTCWP
jgi:endonuclease G